MVQQPKIYFYDVTLDKGDMGKQLEILVALSSHQELSFLGDQDGKTRSLRYLRTKEGREVDFLLTQDAKPLLMVEVKYSDRQIAEGIRYFQERYGYQAVQLVGDLRAEDESSPIPLRRALDWLEKPEEWVKMELPG